MVRWGGDPNALFYEVMLQTGAGEEISVTKVTEPLLKLNLGPGAYRYQVVYYNLLRKPEITLPWQELEVLEAEAPSVERCAPSVWFLEQPRHVLTVRGNDIGAGAGFALRRDAAEPAVAGAELDREGSSLVTVSFPSDALEEGRYALEVTNPGGLSASLPDALLVRHMLPTASGLSPASGATFGPKELRGTRSIRLSWDPVPEATRYILSLYRDGEARASVFREPLADCALDLDFALLDRGEFRWTVEAQGATAEGALIPCIGIAEARFRIELPRLSVPAQPAGDTFYGR